jgi:hypothetical protein
MRLPKICLLLTNFLITSCTASSTPQNGFVPIPVSSPSPSIKVQSPKPTPSMVSSEITDVFELDGIDPALIAKQAKLKVHFKTQSSDFYLAERRDGASQDPTQKSRLGRFPRVYMVITNLGGSASRNYRMAVRLDNLKDMLDTSGALQVLVKDTE